MDDLFNLAKMAGEHIEDVSTVTKYDFLEVAPTLRHTTENENIDSFIEGQPDCTSPDLDKDGHDTKIFEDEEINNHIAWASLTGMSSDSQLSCSSTPSSPLASPRGKDDTTSSSFLKRTRGRPKKPSDEDYDLTEDTRRSKQGKRKRKSEDNEEKEEYRARSQHQSVRRIPCFFVDCTHSYRRPNSDVIEYSDRPLVLTGQYDGYVIRSCKKHHDWWRTSKSDKDNTEMCEICRGLNESDGKMERYENRIGRHFHVCRPCANRQANVLGLQQFQVMPSSFRK
jgi:hypothetical protein